MPNGLPAAITLKRDCIATQADQSRNVTLFEGTIVLPIHPGADQDGWDGEFICGIHESNIKVAIKEEELKL